MLIKKTDPRILLFAVITLIAVTFSIFKAVGSLSGEVDAPGYRNQPPQAFARPLPERIVDPEFLGAGGQRLSDRGYQFAYRSAQELSERIIANKITSSYLQSWGMPAVEANRQARFLAGQYQARLSGRESKTDGPPELLQASVDDAEILQVIRYGGSDLDPQTGRFTINYEIVRSASAESGWRLAKIGITDS